ncbi:hypothetical protein OROHE_000949 [Orobanche hederae]
MTLGLRRSRKTHGHYSANIFRAKLVALRGFAEEPMTLGFADRVPMTLGFAEEPKKSWSLLRQYFPSKAGGTPVQSEGEGDGELEAEIMDFMAKSERHTMSPTNELMRGGRMDSGGYTEERRVVFTRLG